VLRPEVIAEYDAVRTRAAIIERKTIGLLEICGVDRFRWLQGMVSCDTRDLADGRLTSQSSFVLDPTGHVLSDLTLVNVSDSIRSAGGARILMELPLENVARIAGVLDRFLISEDVDITDSSVRWTCLSFQGPDAEVASRIARTIWGASSGHSDAIIATPADHTGSGGIDWYLDVDSANSVLAWLHDSQEWTYSTVGAETQELLRIEAGIPKWGMDIDSTVLAPEAGLRPGQVSLTKGCYVGQEVIARIDSRGHTNRALTGLIVLGDELPAIGDRIAIEDTEGSLREVGRVTSLARSSPAAGGRPIGLGYVRHEHRAQGTRLTVQSETYSSYLETAPLPFFTPHA